MSHTAIYKSQHFQTALLRAHLSRSFHSRSRVHNIHLPCIRRTLHSDHIKREISNGKIQELSPSVRLVPMPMQLSEQMHRRQRRRRFFVISTVTAIFVLQQRLIAKRCAHSATHFFASRPSIWCGWGIFEELGEFFTLC